MTVLIRFALLLGLNLAAFTLNAETIMLVKPAISGYSPVSYFTKNRAEKGSREFAVEHKGKTYFLVSQEQVELFKQNPDQYRPRYNVCPFSLASGKKASLDPENFKIVANSLLLFHKSGLVDGRALWNQSLLSEQELLERADKQYILLEF